MYLGGELMIFVTGPSGAGKTTYTKKLSKEKGVPFVHLDGDHEWAWLHEVYRHTDRTFLEILGEKEYKAICTRILCRALYVFDDAIIEGVPILQADPLLLTRSNLEIRLIDTPKELCIQRRALRFEAKYGKPYPDGQISVRLWEEAQPWIQELKKLPNCKVVL
jgi:adenylate kinase family enzyme